MKKILILLSVVALSLNLFADDYEEPDCDLVLTSFTNASAPIEVWEDDYQQCLYYEWNVTFSSEWESVDIDYTIDLNPEGAFDNLRIYIQDENGQEHEVLHYPYQPIAGRLTLPLYTRTARVVFQSYYGNTGGLYKGFKLYFREGHANTSNHVFLTNVGIGTYPQETLHVNGAIRGGGTNGEVTLKGDNGSVTIGATDAQTMTFNTDKSMFVFNKPISGNANLGALKIMSSTGYLDLGAMDDDYVRFKTNMSAYHFDKPLYLQHTVIRGTGRALLFYTNTNTLGITILHDRVGIGTQNPQYKLDVKGGLYAKQIIADSILHAEQVVVENTIRAQELIVETTGADFVFADDYQLRPLNEVKTFIQENKHLPEVQSAQEMQENGVSVSELQTKLLQKIEELTLYIIQQEERIKQQELRIKILENQQ